MPWAIFENGTSSEPYCVYKENEDGDKVWQSLGCHATRAEAEDQLAALYANEKKLSKLRISVGQQNKQRTSIKTGVPEKLKK